MTPVEAVGESDANHVLKYKIKSRLIRVEKSGFVSLLVAS